MTDNTEDRCKRLLAQKTELIRRLEEEKQAAAVRIADLEAEVARLTRSLRLASGTGAGLPLVAVAS